MRLLALFFAGIVPVVAAAADEAPMRVYVGTYSGKESRGIYLLELDRASGALLTEKGLVAETKNPSFLAIHPDRKFLYAVNEDGSGRDKPGSVSAFAIDAATGKLAPLNKESSQGGGPCHLVVDRTGSCILVANYGGGSVSVLPIKGNGSLAPVTAFIQHQGSSVDRQRQEGPHAHSINLDAGNKFAVAADLGLDKLFVYRLDPAMGTLTPNSPPSVSLAPGGGPRHFAFHPDGRHAFVILEMTSRAVPLKFDPDRGTFEAGPSVSTLPEGFKGSNSTAEVQVHPSGKFLYVSNRGHDSVATFAIDPKTGHLTPVGHQPTGGKTPRNFGIDPSGTFLLAANQDSGTVVAFRIDERTGRLSPTGHSAKVPMPVCVKFTPAK